jgi:3-oxoacyl-[acyl-carrier protein] reductase
MAFDQMKFADWRRVLSINLDSVFLVTSPFVPGMKQRGWGRVVSMGSSTFGSVTTGFVHYITSKGGIMGFTRALASELGPHGITVNAIAPGIIETGFHDRHTAPAVRAGWIKELVPLQRVGLPAEIASVVAFVASDDASYMTGATLDVNGGMAMY